MNKQLLDDLFTIDVENGKFYWKNVSKYHNQLNGKEAGCIRNDIKNYWVIKINKIAYKRGRLLFFYVNGYFPTPCVDHINGNSLDDRICNLRESTITQNAWNHKGRNKKSDLPMGIRKQKDKFVARITVNKKPITIGSFNSVDDATNAYKNKRIEFYGNFSGY